MKKMEVGIALWIRVTAELEVVAVVSPIPGALATAAIALVKVGQVLLPLLLLIIALLTRSPKTDLKPVIAVVAASTAPNIISVAFAASTGEQIELQAKLLNYFLGSNKSNINQHMTTAAVGVISRSLWTCCLRWS